MSSKNLTWESSSSSSSSAAGDRLSSLDRNLLLHILTFLPYKFAVATSLLSSAWRDLWLHRWSNPHSHLRLTSSRDVDRFLSLLRPLPLRLDSLHLSSSSFSSADRLLRLAADLQLQDLSLEAPASADSPDLIPLPPSLVRLTLCNLRIPICFSSHLASLQTLNLHSVSISDEALADVVSSAYLLKTLELRRCRGLRHVKIPGDGLWLENVVVAECGGISRIRIETRRMRRFHFSGEFCETCAMERVARVELEDVYMSCGGKVPMLPRTNWYKAIRRPWFVRVMTLCHVFLRYIAESGVYRNFERLKELQLLLAKIDKQCLMDICSFFGLCRCNGLEKLFIELPTDTNDMENEDLEHIDQQQPLLGTFTNLKTIKINNFKGRTYEMLLVRILLWKATSLDSLMITTHQPNMGGNSSTRKEVDRRHHADQPYLLNFLRLELSSMVKSSSNAEILVRDHDDYRFRPTHHEIYSMV